VELAAVIRQNAESRNVGVEISYPTHRDHAVGGTPYETRFDTQTTMHQDLPKSVADAMK
jgi:hypothetical protein